MRRKRKIIPLLISFVFLAITIYVIVSYSPAYSLTILNQKLSILYIFFTSLFLFITYFFACILRNLRRGLFIAVFVISFLLLNYFKLGQPIFIILLLAIFVAIELLFTRRK
jgi:hypothetical protein